MGERLSNREENSEFQEACVEAQRAISAYFEIREKRLRANAINDPIQLSENIGIRATYPESSLPQIIKAMQATSKEIKKVFGEPEDVPQDVLIAASQKRDEAVMAVQEHLTPEQVKHYEKLANKDGEDHSAEWWAAGMQYLEHDLSKTGAPRNVEK